ncbi:LamG domain-containing protein [Thalassobellus suaedae]|uniref:LamG domain-containing protein n=1 Tax=Thalassobellus suaedae TaxID=3074124 RepID=A0ABY9XVI8_9FLAO|nr:LamG domain-containing protein [Flavobacteriaceae bacterium HL-DH14]
MAQSGDQILDGIGETGLIARYVFDSNVKDWSRNNLHGSINGSKIIFIEDEKFGNVLSLPKNSKAFISLPGEAITGVESLSISAWVFLRSSESEQYFFDFGKDSKSHVFVAPLGIKNMKENVAEIITESGNNYKIASSPLEINTWNHLALVMDIPSKTISTYINGKLARDTKDVELDLGLLFDTKTKKNTLFIGKSLVPNNSYLNAKLHDFRIYRIPLTEKQIGGIYRNALGITETVVNETKGPVDDLPKFSRSNPQLYNQFLTSVPNIEVETVIGNSPRLPRYVKGEYKTEVEGPEVRIIWYQLQPTIEMYLKQGNML